MEIYYDSLTEASWFAELNEEFSIETNEYRLIGSRGKNPAIVDKLVEYDRPDIIVVRNGKPVLVLEKTQEVPTGHNVGQRFARLVRAIEMGVPAVYYFPFDAKKHGEYAGICNLNIRLIYAAERMREIHDTPLLCVNWLTDREGELIVDGTENIELSEMLESYVSSGYSKNCDGFRRQLNKMHSEYVTRLSQRRSYGSLPPSVVCVSTTAFCNQNRILGVRQSFFERRSTYVYTMDMTEEKCKRQDPYTGTAFIYDYMVCRNGPNVENKKANLVLRFPNIRKSVWLMKNPNDPTTKSCNWYLTANLLLFEDGYLELR